MTERMFGRGAPVLTFTAGAARNSNSNYLFNM